jgi:hypothetical protein
MRYVKICPRCGHRNDELSEACEKDGEFLGMVPATQDSAAATLSPSAPPPAVEPSIIAAEPAKPIPGSTRPVIREDADEVRITAERSSAGACAATNPYDEPCGLLYLEVVGNSQTFEVRDGWIVGQSHPTSAAQVQLSGLPGISYVHRHHCQFDYRDSAWQVTPVVQPSFTNPTFLNQQRLVPGRAYQLRNGDRLLLSNIALNIRVVET